MRRKRRQIRQFDSIDLTKSFNDRFQVSAFKPNNLAGNDAFQIIRRNSDVFEATMSSMMLFGSYPWEDESKTRVLFKFPPSDDTNDESLLPFVLPVIKKSAENDNKNDGNTTIFTKIDEVEKSGLNHCTLQNVDPEYFKPHLIDDSSISLAKFMPLYLTNDRSTSPYIFCLQFYASIFTLPSFSHNLSMTELLKHLSKKEDGSAKYDLQFSRLCLCIKTKLPFFTLFSAFMVWILRCELVGRMQMFLGVSDFADYVKEPKNLLDEEKYTEFLDNCFQKFKWPESQKSSILNFIEIFSSLSVPFPNEVISFDKSPFPSFHWKRPNSSITYYSLAQEAMTFLVKCVGTKENFVKLFLSVLLERTIIIHSDDTSLTAWIVLAIHFLVRPLIWASVSISILPYRLNELLGAPYPLICGIAFDIDTIENYEDIISTAVFLDAKRPHLYLPSVNPNMPFCSESNPVISDKSRRNDEEEEDGDSFITLKWKHKKRNSNGDLGHHHHLIGGSGVCNKIYDDLVEDVILPPAPQQKIFTEDIEGCWGNSPSTILTIANHFVSSILKEVDSCIMTNISDPTNTSSIFIEELFMKCFPQVERNYVKLMISTQMFRFFVEQKCKMRSERLKMKQ